MSRVARVVVHPGEARVFAPFGFQGVIRAFPGRWWSRGGKYWVVPLRYVDALADALRAAGLAVFVTGPDGSEWRSGSRDHGRRATPAQTWAEALFAALGPKHGERAFRALLKVIHPDAGGDATLTRELIAARDRARGARAS